MVTLRVGGDSPDDSGAEALEIAVVLVIANVVPPAEAHYLKASSSHCNLPEEFNAPSAAVSLRKPTFSTRGSPAAAKGSVFLRKSLGGAGLVDARAAAVEVLLRGGFFFWGVVKSLPIAIVALDKHLCCRSELFWFDGSGVSERGDYVQSCR